MALLSWGCGLFLDPIVTELALANSAVSPFPVN
jgi:hypothetical protein